MKRLFLISLLLIILTIGTVSASQNMTFNDDAKDISNDGIISEIDTQNILKEDLKTFDDLNTAINGNNDTEIYLNENYVFDNETEFINGITINREVTINGNGFTIDGNKQARIFNVTNTNVILKDINFINGFSDYGGAIYGQCSIINCSFANNNAGNNGGAIFNCTATNCTFTNNTAKYCGGAMCMGTAANCNFTNNGAYMGGAITYADEVSDCIFINNKATSGGAISEGIATNCNFSYNTAEDGGAMWVGTAINCTFTNNQATGLGSAIFNGIAINCTFINNDVYETVLLNETPLTGTKTIQDLINENNDTDIYLDKDYLSNKYITHPVTIHGNGFKIIGKLNIQSDNVTLKDLNFDGASGYYGAAISFEGSNSKIINCNFTNNQALSVSALSWTGKNNSLINCNFINNEVGDIGAIYIGGSENTIVNCNFINNKWTRHLEDKIYDFTELAHNHNYQGGALKLNGGDILIINCTFTNCSQEYGYGGAIYSIGSNQIINCSFENNFATMGGAIYSKYKKITCISCNFTNNTANEGGSIMGDLDCINCHFTKNSAIQGGAIKSTYLNVNECEFIEDYAIDGADIYSDSSRSSIIINSTFTNKIQDIKNHIYWINKTGVIINCNFNTNKTTSYTKINNYKTFADLNKTINGNNNEHIYLDCNYALDYNYLKNNEPEFVNGILINRTVTIHGNGFTIDGKYQTRLFEVTNNNVIFENITFAHGSYFEDYKTGYTSAGGAIKGECTAINCIFTSNHVEGNGGAMYKGTAINCTFIGNSAWYGGAIFEGTAKNCYFENNNAEAGGALYNSNAINSTFKRNRAMIGGAMSSGTAINCTFKDNTASDWKFPERCYGGAMAQGHAINCKFIGNYPDDSENTKSSIASKITAKSNVTSSNQECLIITLNDEYNNPIKYSDMTIKLNENTLTLKTNIKGEAYLSTNDLIANTYTAVITYDGEGYYTPSTITVNFTVEKTTPKITAPSVTTTYNSDKYFVITLKDKNNNALPNENLTIKLNGKTQTQKTDKNGQVKLTTNGLAPKTYTANITFKGNDKYAASSASSKIVVKKATPKITAKAKTFKKSVKTKKYTMTLKANSKALKNKYVYLKVNGKTFKAKTNAKGQATFKITKLTKKGTHKTTITFKGDKYYNKKVANTKITIK